MVRVVAGVLVLILAGASRADADWLITPYLAMGFAGETTFLVPERGAGESKLTVGASVALLGDGLLGLEADIAHTAGFFQGDDPLGLIQSSRVTTMGGNVIVAAPLVVTRESLRPYLVGGLGLIQARSDDVISIFPLDRDLLGLTLGGGAIGMLGGRTGVRFDLRHLKAISGEDGPLARDGVSRLSFWRASLGVVVRY
ncbi:MAG: hypothetical protein FJW14_17530 [Acidimicrobiia bacterium]|nr:hypothetical protein [Acidimicrobiia bacterium]